MADELTPEEEEQKQVADLVFDEALPEGAVLLGWVAALEFLTPEGNLALGSYCSPEMTAWKALGMMTATADEQREAMRAPVYVDEEGED